LRRLGQQSREGARRYAIETARAALVYEKLYGLVTAGVTVSDAAVRAYFDRHRPVYTEAFTEVRETLRIQLLAARGTAAMKRWTAKLARELPVRYAQ
jgi:hypothetical protein